MVKKRWSFKNLEENLKKPGRNSKNSKNLEEIQKTWRKFPKTFGHPVYILFNNGINVFIVIRLCVAKTFSQTEKLWSKLYKHFPPKNFRTF